MDSKLNPLAFPQHGWAASEETQRRMAEKQGMTLLDHIAAECLGPLIASNGVEHQLLKGGLTLADLPKFCAELAYETAYAALVERQKWLAKINDQQDAVKGGQ